MTVARICTSCGVKFTQADCQPSHWAEGRKRCRPCETARKSKYAPKKREAARAWRRENKSRHREQNSQWAKTERGKACARRKQLKAYGLTQSDFDAMLLSQHTACLGCSTSLKNKKACVDHDHKTAVVRGILCHNCNVSIGLLNDDPFILRRLAAYLEKHK